MINRDPRATESIAGRVREPYVDLGIVASIQTAFQRSRLSHMNWRSRQHQGRIDSRTCWRNDARGSVDIFKERANPSISKLNVWLLVDASGSMSGRRACRAQDFCATLVESFKRQPTVRLHVWQHNAVTEAGRHITQLHRVYDATKNVLNTMLKNVGEGNADGFALAGLGNLAMADTRRDERTIIIVISDGAPTEHGIGASSHDLVSFSRNVSDDLRLKGVTVLSIAIAGNSAENANMYGPEWTVPFDEHAADPWGDLARDIGVLFGKAVGK